LLETDALRTGEDVAAGVDLERLILMNDVASSRDTATPSAAGGGTRWRTAAAVRVCGRRR
jgi:hypothetical protein